MTSIFARRVSLNSVSRHSKWESFARESLPIVADAKFSKNLH